MVLVFLIMNHFLELTYATLLARYELEFEILIDSEFQTIR